MTCIYEISGGQHVDYQLKVICPGLKSGTRTRLKTFILRDLSATVDVAACVPHISYPEESDVSGLGR